MRRGIGSAVAVAVLVAGCTLRLWGLGRLALIADESYYWLWSQHLAMAYYDNPAGVALLVRASTLVAGQSEVGIRWLNALLGAGSVCLVYAIGVRRFGRAAALIAASLLAAGAPYVIVSRFVYSDALQLLLLLLCLYLLLPLLDRADQRTGARPTWRFFALGLAMGALLNAKYSAYLYAAGVLAFLVWRRRDLFRDTRTWWAMLIALCGSLPALLWNATHEWASLGWQVRHFLTQGVGRSTLWGGLLHAFRYLTPPVALLAVLGAVCAVRRRQWVLVLPAALLVLPVLLGPADSPRNLVSGVALLLLPAADGIARWLTGARSPLLAWIVTVVVVSLTVVYGVGTVIGSVGPSILPSSSAAATVRRDALGWRDAPALDLNADASLYAIDYSIASQLRYYTGRDVYTAWGQYRLWGVRAICDPENAQGAVQLIALPYVDRTLVTERLHESFREVQGPESSPLREGAETKMLYTWLARGCLVDQETFLDRFDWMDLVAAGDAS